MHISKRWLSVFLPGLLLALSVVPVRADDLEDAQAAFAAGDYQEALLLLRPLLLEENPQAAYLYARMLEEGAGVPKDRERALEYYRRAAAQGNPQARKRLEVLSQQDVGVTEGDSVAVEWFREAAEQGDPEAQFNFAHALESGWGTRRDEVAARRWFQRAAEAGHDGAQLRLGLMMVAGAGGERDGAGGVRWIRRAARNGNRVAEALVQDLLDASGPLDDRVTEILTGLREALWESEDVALARLEELLLADEVAPLSPSVGRTETPAPAQESASPATDVKEAARPPVRLPANVFRLQVRDPGRLRDIVAVYRRAAQDGDMTAQFALGVLYLQGRGVPRDSDQGMEWMRRAAEQGYVPAQSYLHLADPEFGTIPLRGSILLDWAKERALAWDPQAFYLLGRMFQTGRGVSRDPAEALRWLQMAELTGMEVSLPTSVPGQFEKTVASSPGGGSLEISLRDGLMLATILFLVGVILLGWWLYRRRTSRFHAPPGSSSTATLPRPQRDGGGVANEDLAFVRELWGKSSAGEVIEVSPAGQEAPARSERPVVDPAPPPPPPPQNATPAPEVAERRPTRPSSGPTPVERETARSGEAEQGRAARPHRASEEATTRGNVVRLPSDALMPLSTADIDAQNIARERRMREKVDADTLLQELGPPPARREREQSSPPAPQGHGKGGPEQDASSHASEGEPGDASRSLADVQFNIGLMFANGDGVPRNPALAAKWFEKAARQGHADAQFRLGGLHWTGELGEKDLAKAREWLEKAAENGHVHARELLDKIHGRRKGGAA